MRSARDSSMVSRDRANINEVCLFDCAGSVVSCSSTRPKNGAIVPLVPWRDAPRPRRCHCYFDAGRPCVRGFPIGVPNNQVGRRLRGGGVTQAVAPSERERLVQSLHWLPLSHFQAKLGLAATLRPSLSAPTCGHNGSDRTKNTLRQKFHCLLDERMWLWTNACRAHVGSRRLTA